MSERFKPEIVETYNRERALVVRGVPMVGDRVMSGRGEVCEVLGHEVLMTLRSPAGTQARWMLKHCSPVPDEDEALVQAVAEAIDGEVTLNAEELERTARAAIRAMKEGA